MALRSLLLVLISCIPAVYSSGFAESPLDIYLKNNDIHGLELLIKSTWDLEGSSRGVDSKRAPLVSGHWDNGLACRCSNIAQINTGANLDNNTWSKLMDAIYPADHPARFGEFPHLSACLLLPVLLPIPAPPLKSHWDLGQIFGIMADLADDLRLNEDDKQELQFSILETGSVLGLDYLGVAIRFGMLNYLNKQLQDINKAVRLTSIFAKVDDIVHSSDSVGVLKFLAANFPSNTMNLMPSTTKTPFLTKILVACLVAGNDNLVEYIHDNHLSALENALLSHSATIVDLAGLESNQIRSEGPYHSTVSLMSLVPMSLIRLMGSRGTLGQHLLDKAAECDRIDIVETVHQEFNGMLPSQDGVIAAFANGCTRIIDYLSVFMPDFTDIVESRYADIVLDCFQLENARGYRLLLKFFPAAFPPSPDLIAETNGDDNLEIIRFIFFKLLEGIDPAILATPSEQRRELVQDAINLASSNFVGIQSGSIKVIRFFKEQCDEFGLEFPEITMEDILHSLNEGHEDFLDNFESLFDRPVPGLAEISQIGLNMVSVWHMNFFSSRGYTVKFDQDASENLVHGLTNLADLQTLHKYWPRLVPLDSSLLCDLLSHNAPESFEWALANAQPDATMKTCEIYTVYPESLPLYKLAHSAKGWLPSQKNIDSAANEGHLEFLDWAIRASKGSLYPSSKAIYLAFHHSAVVTLRLLHHLRPLDFTEQYKNFKMAAERGALNLLQWFPEYKSNLLNCVDCSFPENIDEWIRTTDETDLDIVARLLPPINYL